MSTHEIEVILSRQWADTLSVPVFLVDVYGNLLFYNESAEEVLGKRFEDTGYMPVETWSIIFTPEDEQGNPIAAEDLPLVITLKTRLPAHGKFWIKSLTGEKHQLSVTCIPLIGESERFTGALAVFWKIDPE